MNKRKKATVIVAGVAAAALILGGTFAWTSISQTAKNEAAGTVNVGGRLHDDFNGTNKDVYVENFTDPYNGGQPIYARVRLDEYMEVGSEAGQADKADRKATPVVKDADINDVTTWTPHVPAENCATCLTAEDCLIHDYWKWDMEGSTTFMPTFNKDKDSLDPDINGTYHGTDDTDKIYYDDYVVYTTDGTTGGNGIAFDAKEAQEGEIYSVVGDAYYDDDPNMDPNDYDVEAEVGGYRTETETHTAKETVNATVITMQAWKDAGSQPGNYWVYDTDGWAYWANPIMPGEATGLLLDGIEMTSNPGEKCYYAINVVGQFATVGDWEKFGADEEDEDYPSEDALEVLDKASQNVPTVTVVNVDGKTLVNRGEEVTFTATTSVGAASAVDTDEYDWVVLNEELTQSTTSTITTNNDGTATLKVGDGEMSAGLYVAARSRTYGAVGTSAVAVQLYTVNVTAQDGATTVNANKTLQFDATVVADNTGEAETSGVTWSVFGGNGTATINETGLLTVDTTETDGAELTVKATSKNGGFTGTCTVTVANKYAVTVSAESDYIDRGDTLQFTAVVTQNGETVSPDVTWTVTGGSATTNIDESGVLTVDAYEQESAALTVTAISKADGTARGTYTVTVNKYEVSVTAGGATTVEADGTLQFSAAVTKNGETDTSGVYWAVSSRNRMTTITPDGLLTVDYTAGDGTPLTVTATSQKDINVSTTYTVTVIAERELQITSNATEVDPGGSLQYSATFLVNDKVEETDPPVTWSVADSQGNAVSHASIDESGKLTVSGTEYGASELYVHAEYAAAETTSSLSVANVLYTLTLETTGTFTLDGLRVDVAEPYYSVGDISAAFSGNTGGTRYKYTVNEDSNGVYLMITHDDNYYEYADHGTRALTVTATGGENASRSFACNSHENNVYTMDSDTANSYFDHAKRTKYTYNMMLMEGSTQIDEQYVEWDVTANSKAPQTSISSDGLLTLALAEYSPFVTIYYRTENSWGVKDIRVRYNESVTVSQAVFGLELHFEWRDTSSSYELLNNPDTMVRHSRDDGDNALLGNSSGNGGRTYHFRLYDQYGNIIEEPLNMSIWLTDTDTNITGAINGPCTNGYNASTSVYGDGHGYYWFWVPAGSTTKVTFWISYIAYDGCVGTFRATIW